MFLLIQPFGVIGTIGRIFIRVKKSEVHIVLMRSV